MCNFLGSVSSQQKLEVTDFEALRLSQLLDRSVLQLRVTAQFYLENKKKYIHKAWGHADPKDAERKGVGRGREPPGSLTHLFMFFSPHPWPAPCKLIGLARRAVCSTWGPHSGPWTFLCSIFVGFSLPCLLATAILDSFYLF